MAAADTIIKKVEIQYSSTGVDKTNAEAKQVAKSQGDLAKATDAVGAAEERVARRRPTMAEAQAKFQRQTEQTVQMQQQLVASNDAIARSLDEMSKAQAQAAQGSGALVQAANDNASAMDRVSDSFKTAAKWAAEHPLIAIAGAGLAARALSSLAGTAGSALSAASAATARYATTSTAMGGAVAGASVVASRGLGVAASASTAASGGLGVLSVALRSITGPMGLILAAAGGLAVGFSQAGSSAEELGKSSEEVERVTGRFEKLVQLGKQAESLDVSGPFIKAFTGLGAKMGVEVDQMQAALQKASTYVRDEFEQVNKLKAKITELQQLGYSGAEPFKANAQFDVAKNNEERIRAAYKLMEELEEKGQKFAVLDLAANFFPPEMVDRLRTGRSTISQIVSDLDEAGRKSLLKQEDVQRARELSIAIEKTKEEIWSLFNIRGDVSGLSNAIQEMYLSALTIIKTSIENIKKQWDDLAGYITTSTAWQTITSVLNKIGIVTSLTEPPAKAPEIPKEPETIGYRNTSEMFGPHLKDYQNYLKTLGQAKQVTQETVSSYDLLIQRTNDRIEELNLEAQAVGGTRDEVIKLKLAHDLERAALKDGTTVTKEMREEWDRLGTKLAGSTNRLEDSRRALENTREAQRELASEFATFADDIVLGGQKIGDAFGSLSKSFASSSLKALLTGEGSLAGLYGTASIERGQVGGLLGGHLDIGKILNTSALKDAIGEGAYTGISDAMAPLLKPRTDASGRSLGFMSSPLAQGLGVTAAGASVGYSSGNPFQGVLAGGLAGLMTGNPALAAVGAAGGLIGGAYGQNPSRKKDRDNERRQRVREFAACGDADGLVAVRA